MSDDLETLLRNGLGSDLLDGAPVVERLAATVRRRHRRRLGLALAATMGMAGVVAAGIGLAAHPRSGSDGRLIAVPMTTRTAHSTPPTQRSGDITVEGLLVRATGH